MRNTWLISAVIVGLVMSVLFYPIFVFFLVFGNSFWLFISTYIACLLLSANFVRLHRRRVEYVKYE